ncbi:hypothetical protein FQR65_LT09332 [Abscondita terminalis]|nr:hypothetical protein FQR65_LT09332 [Abscondita terminalis]
MLSLNIVVCVFIVACHCEYERLPKALTPIRYTLVIQTNFPSELSYTGKVTLDFKVQENTQNITLHKKNLVIDRWDLAVIDTHNRTINITSVSYSNTSEIYVITLERVLITGGHYRLLIKNFTNAINHERVGFYSADEHLALTDFQPSDARSAFPCFDEPALKSNFSISVIRKRELKSASNAQLAYTRDLGNGLRQDVYEETPPMSTYLVAWAVFDYKTTKTVDRNRIIGRPEDVDRNRFDNALITSAKVMEAFEKYTGLRFPLKKLESLAVPDLYFRDAAMENWGLIVYKETDLLQTDQANAKDVKSSFICIAHEIGHQWFGNLVTPSWWDHIWLSESFSAYFQYHVGDLIEPSWKLVDQFVVDGLHTDAARVEVNVTRVLSVWESLEGFPLVTVTRNYTTNLIKLEQDRYYFKGKLALQENWTIPITLICGSSGTHKFLDTTTDYWLTSKTAETVFECTRREWLLVNKQQVGYYRVNYDEENWERLIAFMNSPKFRKIHVLNRAQLIDDAFSLAKSKLISYEVPLRLCRYLTEETAYIPFKAFYKGLDTMNTRELRKESKEFGDYVFRALRKVYKVLGFNVKTSNSMSDRLNRIEMVDCLEYAQTKMREMVKAGESVIHPDVEQTVLCKGIKVANETEYDVILKVFTSSKDLFQRSRLRVALSCNGPLSYKNMHLLEFEIK